MTTEKKPPVPSFGHSESARQQYQMAMSARRNTLNQTLQPPAFERGQGSGGGFWEGISSQKACAMRKTDGFPRHQSVNPRASKANSTLDQLTQRSAFPEIGRGGPSVDLKRPINALDKPQG